MDDRVKAFLDGLKAELAGIPELEVQEALEYYEEYINDALDEGESAEIIVSRLDPPEKTAAVIMAEMSLRKVQNSPGLKNYSRVLRYARKSITRPFSILVFSIFICVTYGIAILLFLSSVVSAAAACVVLPWLVYEALRIPAQYTAEIIGTIGFGIFSAAVFLLPAVGFFKLCGIFIKLSARIVGRMLNRSSKQPYSQTGDTSGTPEQSSANISGKSKWFLRVCLAALAAGMAISLASGLPVKLFMIFNSERPSSITMHDWEFDQSDVKTIKITTSQSHIRLERGKSDKIKITCEQPDWTKPEVTCSNGALSFNEVFNGRLPLFPFVALHENRTDVILSLPSGMNPESLKLESRGGIIHIETGEFNASVKTYTGSVYIEPSTSVKAGIRAETRTGAIHEASDSTVTRTDKSTRYESLVSDGKKIVVDTERGDVFIE